MTLPLTFLNNLRDHAPTLDVVPQIQELNKACAPMDDDDDFLLDLLSYTCPRTGKLRIAGGRVEPPVGRLEFLRSYSAFLFELFVDDMLTTQFVTIVSVDCIMLCSRSKVEAGYTYFELRNWWEGYGIFQPAAPTTTSAVSSNQKIEVASHVCSALASTRIQV